MFGRKRSNGYGSRRSSARKHSRWSSSVVGTHASSGKHSTAHRRASSRRPSASTLEGRAAEVNQIHFDSRSVDSRSARYKVGESRTQNFMRRRSRMTIVAVVAAILVVAAVALSLGTCAFRGSLSSSMALDDPSVSEVLAAPASESDPQYVMLVGISDDGTDGEAASFIALMRIDAQSKTVSLLNIPSNISCSYDNAAEGDGMLRDAPHAVNEGELVSRVSSLVEQDINHYVRITEEGFVSLVDSLGGLAVTVDTYVDDPTVGITVIDPGEQTLNGTQALAYVSAKNYTDGFEVRSQVQNQVLSALIATLESQGGLSFVFSADELAGTIETDLDYDALSSLASAYSGATVYTSTVPGSQTVAGDSVYWSVSPSSWATLRDQFKGGQNMDLSVDTSGVNRGSLSIKVLNGTGNDGYAAQVAQRLEGAGYTVQETGNADAAVYDETLVVYRSDDDKTAAEAVVQDLGCGRAVSAGVYYSLTTDIQVMVGNDWTGGGV